MKTCKLDEYKLLNESLQSKVSKLTTELSYLTEFASTELKAYNEGIVAMRQELVRIRDENQRLKKQMLEAQQTTFGVPASSSEGRRYSENPTVSEKVSWLFPKEISSSTNSASQENLEHLRGQVKLMETAFATEKQELLVEIARLKKRLVDMNQGPGIAKLVRRSMLDSTTSGKCYAAPTSKTLGSQSRSRGSDNVSRSRGGSIDLTLPGGCGAIKQLAAMGGHAKTPTVVIPRLNLCNRGGVVDHNSDTPNCPQASPNLPSPHLVANMVINPISASALMERIEEGRSDSLYNSNRSSTDLREIHENQFTEFEDDSATKRN